MASICNDEQAAFGVMSGHERKTLGLSVVSSTCALVSTLKNSTASVDPGRRVIRLRR